MRLLARKCPVSHRQPRTMLGSWAGIAPATTRRVGLPPLSGAPMARGCSHARTVETCFGVEPNRSAFAARSAPGAARRCASDRICTGTDGLEDRGAAGYTTLARAAFRNRTGTAPIPTVSTTFVLMRQHGGPARNRTRVPEFWRLRCDLRSDPSSRPVRESDPSQPMDSRSATPVASRGIFALLSRIERERIGLGGRAPNPSARAVLGMRPQNLRGDPPNSLRRGELSSRDRSQRTIPLTGWALG